MENLNDVNKVLETIQELLNKGEYKIADTYMNYYGILKSNLTAITDGSVPGLPRNNNVLVRAEFDVSNFALRTYGLTYRNTNRNKKDEQEQLSRELKKVQDLGINYKITVVSVGNFISDLKPGDVIPINAITHLSAVAIPNNSSNIIDLGLTLAEVEPKDIESGSTSHIIEYATVEGSSINYFIRD